LEKSALIKKFCTHLESEILSLKAAARATYEAATHEESKPENEYDTRGLEASYLAGAQAKRVAELEALYALLKNLEPREFKESDPISLTALVEVDLNGKAGYLFVLSKGGGFTLPFDGQTVQIVTPSSPLGEALIGLRAGDVAAIEVGDQTKEYEIVSVS
jgi:hypothetical protein